MIKSLYLNFPIMLNIFMISILLIPSKMMKMPPMSLMFILMIYIILVTMVMNLIYYSITSFITFMIMIGGMMIIYMYITTMANNELFTLSLKSMTSIFMKFSMTMMMMMMMMIYFKELMMFNSNHQDSWLMYKFLNVNNFSNINMLYMNFNNKMIYFIMMYLYYSMICMTSICYKFKTPLRQMMY